MSDEELRAEVAELKARVAMLEDALCKEAYSALERLLKVRYGRGGWSLPGDAPASPRPQWNRLRIEYTQQTQGFRARQIWECTEVCPVRIAWRAGQNYSRLNHSIECHWVGPVAPHPQPVARPGVPGKRYCPLRTDCPGHVVEPGEHHSGACWPDHDKKVHAGADSACCGPWGQPGPQDPAGR